MCVQFVQAAWLDVQPAYYPDYRIGTARLEGGASLTDSLAVYGFSDFYGQRRGNFDLNTYYGEVRLMQSLSVVKSEWKAWSATVEVNGGTDYDGITRFGLVWNTSFWKGNATALKFYPVATRDHDAQASIYFSQAFSDAFSAYLIFDYGFGDWVFGEEQIYVELELKYKLGKRVALFAQGRQFEVAEGFKLDPTPVLGMKISF
jgi:hypothetical protein